MSPEELAAPAFDDPSLALPWSPGAEPGAATAYCNICRWSGGTFLTPPHSEGANCPVCDSIARDRFLHLCWLRSWDPVDGGRVLETSPRLDHRYRDMMGRRLHYTASDFDERAHKASRRVDLQSIDLPDNSLDVVLTAYVLEHVPDTDAALAELYRVVCYGGLVVLQVPVLQGTTTPPTEPEFHADNTPVFWRFGPDLTDRLRAVGFATRLVATQGLIDALDDGWPDGYDGQFDVPAILRSSAAAGVEPVCSNEEAHRLGIEPAYMFVTWICRKPDPTTAQLVRAAPRRVVRKLTSLVRR